MEWFKNLSDRLVLWCLRASSGFGKELTADGKREQRLWRDQRRRNLNGLALRARERVDRKDTAAS